VFVVTALVYLAATAAFLLVLAGRGDRLTKVAPWLVGIGAGLHGAHVVVSSYVLHVCPVEGIHFAISVLSMFTCAAYLAVRLRFQVDVLGAFVAPLALASLLASRFVAPGPLTPTVHVRSAIVPVHVTMNLVGVALFSLAFGAATLYLVQERLLKRKKIDGLFTRLPPLDALDRAEHRFLLAGFPLLTLGVLTGTVWAQKIEAGSTQDLLRAGLGYATWILIAGVLLLRAAAGWRGRKAAYGTIAGFGFAMLVLLLYLLRGAGGEERHARGDETATGGGGDHGT
jgi:ABC-type uncharacterized transport system permease subunit